MGVRGIKMTSSNLSFALFTSVALGLMSGTALGHKFGNGQSDLTPPIIAYAEEIEALKKDFGGAAPSVRGVFLMTNLWNAGSMLKACFYDGESGLKAFFVR